MVRKFSRAHFNGAIRRQLQQEQALQISNGNKVHESRAQSIHHLCVETQEKNAKAFNPTIITEIEIEIDR